MTKRVASCSAVDTIVYSEKMFKRNVRKSVCILLVVAGLGFQAGLNSPATAAEATEPSFTRGYINPNGGPLILYPGTSRWLNARYTSEPLRVPENLPLPDKALFGEVSGYPADMPLLASVTLATAPGSKSKTPEATLVIFSTSLVEEGSRTIDLRYSSSEAPVGVTLVPGIPGLYDRWQARGTELAFTGTQEAINRALRRLYLIAGGPEQLSLKFMVTRDEGAAYNVENDHFYQFVSWSSPATNYVFVPPVQRTWTKALADAAELTFKGVKGHLATITSDSENAFVRDRLEGARNVFLAGADKDREGQWKWYAGPESGQVFWEARCAAADTCNGEVTYIDRTPAVNTYSAWAVSDTDPTNVDKNEPNDWGAGPDNVEDYLVTNRFISGAATQDPRWNDLPIGGSFIGGYVAEFCGKIDAYSGVSTRNFMVDIRPSPPRLNVKRTSDSTVAVSGGAFYLSLDGWKVEVQRRSGDAKNFETLKELNGVVRSDPPYGTSKVYDYTDKLPLGNTYVAHEYRLKMTHPNFSTPVHSYALTIPVASPAPKLVADLAFKVGTHVSNFVASVFKGLNLKPNSKFKITLRSTPVVLLNERVGSDGSLSALLDIPDTIESGDHTVTIEGTEMSGKSIKTVAKFTLNEDRVVTKVSDSTTTGDTLPETGSSALDLTALAVLLVGFGVVLTARRRRPVH